MKKKIKEIRFFLIDYTLCPKEFGNISLNSVSDEEFMTESERQGFVYSLEEFQYQFNATDCISTNMFLRIIEI